MPVARVQLSVKLHKSTLHDDAPGIQGAERVALSPTSSRLYPLPRVSVWSLLRSGN